MNWSEKEILFLRENYYNKGSRFCSNKLNRTENAIIHKASRLKIIGSMIQHRKYTYNSSIFSIINPYNSYWAGFIAADGCVYYSKKSNNNYAVLKLNLSIKDKNILTNFINFSNYTGKYTEYIKTDKKKAVRIHIENPIEWILNLNKYWNITSRKSLTLRPPNLTKREDILSYIIGYIDGDGCFHKDYNKYLRLQIIGTKEVLTWINNQFNNIGSIYKKHVNTNKNTYILYFGGKNVKNICIELNTHIKKYNLIVLERKWNKTQELL